MQQQTASQTVGPYFRIGMIRGGKNTLAQDETLGEQIHIKGQVLDGGGHPVDDACVEIWQADAQGYFNHPTMPRPILIFAVSAGPKHGVKASGSKPSNRA